MSLKLFLRQLAGRFAGLRKHPLLGRWLRQSSRPGAWITTLFVCFATVFTLLTFVLPKRAFSEKENRALAEFPALSFASLADGSFARGVEQYFADHFIGRDFWISLNLKEKTFFGQKENGGVYLGKRKTLYLKPSEPNAEALEKNLAAMDAFAAAHPEARTFVAIIPNAVSAAPANLPAHAPVPDQAALLKKIAGGVPHARFIDVTPALSDHADEQIYYRTDHHWTSLGAYYAFAAMAPELDISSPVPQYHVYPVSTTFSGTLAARSGRGNTRDTVELYVPDTDVTYNVTYVETKEKTATLYNREALSGRDQYAVFFGGNHPRVEIKTTAGTGRRLLVFKDSYANCLMQFLYPYFDEIVMVDPRYYYDAAEPLLTQHAITDVLYLYNCDTFCTDTSLADVLAAPAAVSPNPQTVLPEDETLPSDAGTPPPETETAAEPN